MDDSTVPTNPSSSRRQKNNVKTAAADAKCQKSQNVVNGTEICGGRRGRKRGTGGASMRKL
uniref:Uncharacterized protein n=1 Tax=Romanomermis culicivorax TaxID=13658 RepID=A0A915JFA8_ROMCU